jgi:hypothetical protein
MKTSTILAKLKCPIRHPQFLAPGLLFIVIGSLLFIATPWLSEAREFIKFNMICMLTGTLLLCKTRIGTFLYFCVLVGLALKRYERGLGLPTFSNFFDLALSLLILYWFIGIGWYQLDYHFNTAEHTSQQLKNEGEQVGAQNP